MPGNRSTQAAIGSETVTIAVSTDKKMIILTYCITLKGDFVPVQMIYGGKTIQSIPHMSFRSLFCICVNERHTGIPGLWTQELDAGLWTLDYERWTLDAGLWTLVAGR